VFFGLRTSCLECQPPSVLSWRIGVCFRKPKFERFFLFGEEDRNQEGTAYMHMDASLEQIERHFGIEHQRFVIPLETRSPELSREKWGWQRKGGEKDLVATDVDKIK
jgi:hypothetical protein